MEFTRSIFSLSIFEMDRITSGRRRVVGLGFFKDAHLESFPERDVFQVGLLLLLLVLLLL